MRKMLLLLSALAVSVAALPGASAGPSAGGYSSDNIEWVSHVPFEVGTATGSNFWSQGKDRYMIVTGWKSFSIYNINDPANPVQESIVPFGFQFENEDVATNGEIMLFSETLPRSILHIWNVEDVTNPVEIAALEGAGQHTTSCLLDCKWGYGSSGNITDLRDPENPKLMKEKWSDGMPPHGGYHDVTEVAKGLVLTSTSPMLFLDARKDPRHPKLLAVSTQRDGVGLDFHSNLWPRNAKDRWAVSSGETCCGAEQCGEATSAGLTSWDTKGWQKTHTLQEGDSWTASQGTITDGGGAASAPFGCSAHWFTMHPTWKNGGILAAGWYNSGTRVLQVNAKGKFKEVGWFLPHAGGTSGAYWIDKEYIYAVDYQRGIDILRYTGKT